MAEANNILRKDYLDKARVLIISVLVAVVINTGIAVLLDIIIISKPQNAPPLFSVNPPPAQIIDKPHHPVTLKYVIVPIIPYTVTLHTTFTPFPAPPNPGKLERPLRHFHDDPRSSSNCPFCQPLGKLTSITSLSFGK